VEKRNQACVHVGRETNRLSSCPVRIYGVARVMMYRRDQAGGTIRDMGIRNRTNEAREIPEFLQDSIRLLIRNLTAIHSTSEALEYPLPR
jgi:hypothetical protein